MNESDREFCLGFAHASGKPGVGELSNTELKMLAASLLEKKAAGGNNSTKSGIFDLVGKYGKKAFDWAKENPRAASTIAGTGIGAGVGAYRARKQGRSMLGGAALGGAIGAGAGFAAPTVAYYGRTSLNKLRDRLAVGANQMFDTGPVDQYRAIGHEAMSGFGGSDKVFNVKDLKNTLTEAGIDISNMSDQDLIKNYTHTGKGGTIFAKFMPTDPSKQRVTALGLGKKLTTGSEWGNAYDKVFEKADRIYTPVGSDWGLFEAPYAAAEAVYSKLPQGLQNYLASINDVSQRNEALRRAIGFARNNALTLAMSGYNVATSKDKWNELKRQAAITLPTTALNNMVSGMGDTSAPVSYLREYLINKGVRGLVNSSGLLRNEDQQYMYQNMPTYGYYPYNYSQPAVRYLPQGY